MDARKQRYGAGDLEGLFGDAARIVALKGKQRVDFELKRGWPAPGELEAALIGPTGNLRAPALRVGKTVLVGFGEEAYGEVLA